METNEVLAALKAKADAAPLYERMKAPITALLDKYLSLNLLKNDQGEVRDDMPDWLNIGIADRILAEYRQMIADVTPESLGVDIPSISPADRPFLAQWLTDMANHYENVDRSTPHHYALDERYDAAQRITLREYLMQDNDKDVAEYATALRTYCRDLCGTELVLRLADIYRHLARRCQIS